MLQKTKNALLAAIALVTLILILYTLSLFQSTAERTTYVLSGVLVSPTSEGSNTQCVFKDRNFSEKVIGCVNNKLIINYTHLPPNSAVYIYDTKQGKKELITKYGDYFGKFMGYTEISPYILNDKKLLLHFNYNDNIALLTELNNLKTQNNDSTYSTIEEEVPENNEMRVYVEEIVKNEAARNIDAESAIKIFDLPSKETETIFEYKSKYRSEGMESSCPLNSFQGLCYSSNSHFIAWCIEEKLGVFTFYIYDTALKNINSFKITDNQIHFNYIESPSISNDGKTVFFIGKSGCGILPKGRSLPKAPVSGSGIYKLALEKSKLELIVDDVLSYKLSSNNRYIVYDRLLENAAYKGILECLELSTMYTSKIDDGILSRELGAFDLSPSGNTAAYIKNSTEGSKVFIGKFETHKTETAAISILPVMSSVDCIKFDEAGKKLLVDYSYKNTEKDAKQSTCFIDLSQINFKEQPSP